MNRRMPATDKTKQKHKQQNYTFMTSLRHLKITEEPFKQSHIFTVCKQNHNIYLLFSSDFQDVHFRIGGQGRTAITARASLYTLPPHRLVVQQIYEILTTSLQDDCSVRTLLTD